MSPLDPGVSDRILMRTDPVPQFVEHTEAVRDVLAGLSRAHKALPGKYLWDEVGSDLFDRICRTDDYYLTRHETALIEQTSREIAGLVGSGVTIVEFGSGASHKVRLLLDALVAPCRYVAIDISRQFLDAATQRIAQDYPEVEVVAVCADYTKPLDLPAEALAGARLGLFPGSTIGNFDPAGAVAFLMRARMALGHSRLLVGVDPNRSEHSLLRAYGNADGLMAALHKNLLVHLNRLIGTSVDPDNFRHEVRLRDDPFRVEAHLVALQPVVWRVADRAIAIAAGESIHTDSSYKYDPDTFRSIAERAGWNLEHSWLDQHGLFSLHLLRS
jgi:dimethylhistidine N-methyltransferase